MVISADWIDDFRTQTYYQDAANADLGEQVLLLHDAATRSITSFLGWSLTLTTLGQNVRLSQVHPGMTSHDVNASLGVPLLPGLINDVNGMIVFYAGRRDAFHALAASLAPEPADQMRLNLDTDPDLSANIEGFDDFSTFNRAIGFLVAQGQTVEGASSLLEHEAQLQQVPVSLIANAVLNADVEGVETEQCHGGDSER